MAIQENTKGGIREKYTPSELVDGLLLREDEKVVLVLGAGASISEMAAHNSDVPLPPTDANFLERAKECVPNDYERVKILYNQLWNDVPPYPLKFQRMEQVFSSVYLNVLQTSGNSKQGRLARNLFNKLVELLRDTLSHSTGKADSNQHLELLNRIKQEKPGSLNILSFNYDVLVDRALREGNRRNLWSWSHTDGYGFKPSNHSIPRNKSNIKLLKPHGSMNWYIPKPVYQKKMQVYIPQPGGKQGSPSWQRRQRRLGHKPRLSHPLMVPPVFEKGTQINGMLQSIWQQASELLSRATVVIIWGYSLPETDYHAEVLFAQAARKARFRLIPINLDREALGRVTGVCGHTWNRWYFRVEHLLRDLSLREEAKGTV